MNFSTYISAHTVFSPFLFIHIHSYIFFLKATYCLLLVTKKGIIFLSPQSINLKLRNYSMKRETEGFCFRRKRRRTRFHINYYCLFASRRFKRRGPHDLGGLSSFKNFRLITTTPVQTRVPHHSHCSFQIPIQFSLFSAPLHLGLIMPCSTSTTIFLYSSSILPPPPPPPPSILNRKIT